MKSGIENKVIRFYEIDTEMKELTEEKNTLKTQIIEYFKKYGVPSIEIQHAAATIEAKVTSRMTVDYDPVALREALDDELANEVIKKSYTITHIKPLIAALKKAGVSPKEFKSWLHVSEFVDKDQIQQLFALGEITKAMLKGCYTAKLTKSISIKKKG